MKESYRSFKAWEEAIDLSLLVHSLIESLPSDERSALATSLNAAAVNIPTSIALNLIHMQVADIRDLVSLQTQLELVDRIYPALDTAEVAETGQALLNRLQDPARFRETIPHNSSELASDDEVDESEPEEALEAESDQPVRPTHVDIQS